MSENRKNEIKHIIDLYRKGKMIIVTDDEDRENEGDLMISSEYAREEDIAFMAANGRGLICIAIDKETGDRLNLPLMCNNNNSQFSTAFTVSVDAALGTTTGISAADRLKTIQTIIDMESKPEDLLRPGHLFPLLAENGGLSDRRGHTEAAVDLAKLCSHFPSGIICEIMGDDGSMLRGAKLEEYARVHNMKQISINEIMEYMESSGTTMGTSLPTSYGDFDLYHFPSSLSSHMPHIALVHKNIDKSKPITVRVHSECLTGDLFGSLRCDCGDQLKEALARINKDEGVLLYMRQEGRGIGLAEKMEAYRLQDDGLDTVEANIQLGFAADERNYREAAEILKSLQVENINLLTNNPHKIENLRQEGISINERLAIEIKANRHNRKYMKTKKEKMEHLFVAY